MGIGSALMQSVSPILESIAPFVPGEVFPYYFSGLFQNSLVAAVLVTSVAGFLGSFLLVRNLSLIGDGLAHVSFGGICVGIVMGSSSPLWFALVFSIFAAILIFEMQRTEILTGDASIAIFLTGFLAFGLLVLRLYGGGITIDVEGFLFGSVNLIDEQDLDLIVVISLYSILSLLTMQNGLLAITIDPLAAQVQGLPARGIGIFFSVTTAAVVVSMVQIVGTLLVTALLVTPAATAQLVGRSFRSCLIWTQVFGLTSVILGIYLSAEMVAPTGAMIAVVAASIFAAVGVYRSLIMVLLRPGINP